MPSWHRIHSRAVRRAREGASVVARRYFARLRHLLPGGARPDHRFDGRHYTAADEHGDLLPADLPSPHASAAENAVLRPSGRGRSRQFRACRPQRCLKWSLAASAGSLRSGCPRSAGCNPVHPDQKCHSTWSPSVALQHKISAVLGGSAPSVLGGKCAQMARYVLITSASCW